MRLDWGDASPRSIFFDDIYFSGDGVAETTHVFLDGNGLPARFERAQDFTIGELGFGAGLNFLVAWRAWLKAAKPQTARLHFLSVEAFPLTTDDLRRVHQQWPDLSDLSAPLIENWPPPHRGLHQISFAGGVTLTLYFGDALDGVAQAEACVDAWFLDGFAPSKNPDMWSDDLMREIARLSSPLATFSTFTVAGGVRRSLRAAGFEIEKRPGFGRKREMLSGALTHHITQPSKREPWFDRGVLAPLISDARIAIIGGGIAGASLAHALTAAGFAPVVYEADAPASGASGNPAGLIMPRLDADDTPAAKFFAQAYLHTIRLLTTLQKKTPGILFNACGVQLKALNETDQRRHQKLIEMPALPDDWIEQTDGDLYFPQGGVVDPACFVRALLGETRIINQTAQRLQKNNKTWIVEDDGGNATAFDIVIVANGLEAIRFSQLHSLPLTGSVGQIEWFPDAAAPDHANAFGPYAAPAPKGGLIIGATYAPITIGEMPAFTPEATQSNIDAVARTLPDIAAPLTADASRPRASIRCTTPDRLPVAGPAPDWGFYAGAYDGLRQGRKGDYPQGQMQEGLYLLSGLGSRGLVTAPLAAAMIAGALTGGPSPVEPGVAEALHPARFFIRDLKRAKSPKPRLK